MTTYDLITLGETMLRLSPPTGLRMGQSERFEISFGGAESNVASNLARLGRRTAWWSCLPETPLARQLAASLRSHGVDTGAVRYVPDARLGTYYLEFGNAPRPTRVWYDRKDSAASHMHPEHIPAGWLASGRWLHLTGITPALSPTCHQTAEYALNQARAAGATISFDVNYRALLWSPAQAGEALEGFCQQADVVFVARRDAALLFGVAGTGEQVARALQTRWGGMVFVTDGEQGAHACAGQHQAGVPAIPVTQVDRIGAGDAFASGVIDQLLDSAPVAQALRYGTALAALKLTIAGDIAHTSRAEVDSILSQEASALHR